MRNCGTKVILFAGLLAGIASSTKAEDRPLREMIDASISVAWQHEKVTSASPASDAEFLRRIYLDLIGTIPSYEEAATFLGSTDSDKREKLIERLFEDPRYAQHQADIWDMILFGRNPPGYETDKRDGIQSWLQTQFASNTPYDKWVRELLKADGNSVEQGPPMYFVQYRNQPEDANEAITQTFLGVQLQCARCHDHPFESWKQLDFYGMAAFLARLEVVTVGKKENLSLFAIGEKNTGDVLFTGPAKNQVPGKKGEPVKPKFLIGETLQEPALPADYKEVKFEANKVPPKPQFSRKDQLADWITRPDNPYFARAVANRLWAQFMGRGIVHPVDNLSAANAPSHPELLDALTKQLLEKNFDLKWYIRELVNSKTYQLTSATETSEAKPHWFQYARTRPLSAEELVDAWRVSTGFAIREAASEKKPTGPKSRLAPFEAGYVVKYFGQPNNGVGDFQGGLYEHLYMNNGPMHYVLVTGAGSLIDALNDGSKSWDQRVERLYLSLLTRSPTADEKQKFVEFLSQVNDKQPQERIREAIWSLMTCSEFRFNH